MMKDKPMQPNTTEQPKRSGRMISAPKRFVPDPSPKRKRKASESYVGKGKQKREETPQSSPASSASQAGLEALAMDPRTFDMLKIQEAYFKIAHFDPLEGPWMKTFLSRLGVHNGVGSLAVFDEESAHKLMVRSIRLMAAPIVLGKQVTVITPSDDSALALYRYCKESVEPNIERSVGHAIVIPPRLGDIMIVPQNRFSSLMQAFFGQKFPLGSPLYEWLNPYNAQVGNIFYKLHEMGEDTIGWLKCLSQNRMVWGISDSRVLRRPRPIRELSIVAVPKAKSELEEALDDFLKDLPDDGLVMSREAFEDAVLESRWFGRQ